MIGGLVVLAVWALFAFGLPLLNRVLPGDDGFVSGKPYPVSPAVTIVPARGWRLDLDESSPGSEVIAKYGSSTFTALIGTSGVKTTLAQSRAEFTGDKTTTYRLSDSKAFTTDAGVSGQTFLAESTKQTNRVWVIGKGATTVSLSGLANPRRFALVNPAVSDMVDSTRFTGTS